MDLFKSRAKEPKQRTWKILGKRWQRSGIPKQDDWIDNCLRKAGYDPDIWMKTGEMPSELICRYASESRQDIDTFLLAVTKG